MPELSSSHPRIAVIGAGAFGRNHLRVIHQSPRAELAGVLDLNWARAEEAARAYNCPIFDSMESLAAHADAVVVATPTIAHREIGCRAMELGLDVLVEKPLAQDPESGRELVETAARTGRILQTGHLERFNPAVIALREVITKPLFFEIHRLSEFTPRSLDVDVVLDLMIHDIDIVLSMVGEQPVEIRAAGISILTPKVDIANVRLEFPGGCVANLTASRVSTERVRKLRLFQPHEYISLDYTRKDAIRFRVKPPLGVDSAPLPVVQEEPLRLELEGFIESVSTRAEPRVTGAQGLAALEAACAILAKIKEHSQTLAHILGAP